MRGQSFWLVVLDESDFETQRLYAHDVIEVAAAGQHPQPGDPAALVAALTTPVLFGLGVISGQPSELVRVRYTHRMLDNPVPADLPGEPLGLRQLVADDYAAIVSGVQTRPRVDADRSEWFVTLVLPIEAASPGEAVREFWSYVDKLGPRELPAFVWPRGNELGMQAYVLGAETNLDPEEDE